MKIKNLLRSISYITDFIGVTSVSVHEPTPTEVELGKKLDKRNHIKRMQIDLGFAENQIEELTERLESIEELLGLDQEKKVPGGGSRGTFRTNLRVLEKENPCTEVPDRYCPNPPPSKKK